MTVLSTLNELRKQYPQVEFRPLQGEADFANIVKIGEDMTAAGLMDQVPSLEQIHADYTHLGNCNLERDSIILLLDGEPLAYSRITHNRADQEALEHYHAMRRITQKGIGMGLHDALMAWNESRVREMIAEDPNGLPGTINYGARKEDAVFRERLEAHGFEPILYYFLMARSLAEPIPDMPMPAGLELRPFKAGQERQIWDASNEAFKDEAESEIMTEADYERWLADPEFKPELYQIGWDGDEIAGMVMAYIDEDYNRQKGVLRGYTEGISVRRPWRGRGLAKALICRSMQQFKDMGMQEVALAVDAHNPSGALRLYSGLGYKEYRTDVAYRKKL